MLNKENFDNFIRRIKLILDLKKKEDVGIYSCFIHVYFIHVYFQRSWTKVEIFSVTESWDNGFIVSQVIFIYMYPIT